MRRHNWALKWGLAIGLAICCLWLGVAPSLAADNQYQIANRASFNQVKHYPRSQTLPPDLYQPTGNWVGRLILPTVAEAAGTDWVWLEVHHAPPEAQDLVGRSVRLEWGAAPAVQQYVAAVTRDVKFDDTIANSQSKGNLHPDRLNGRLAVGPLQSLAGAHPIDDVFVILDQATVLRDGNLRLQIDTDPVIQTGQFYALVKILAPVKSAQPEFVPADCPGTQPCGNEQFQVQHYNALTRQFDGPIATMRIPQQPRDWIGVFASTPRGLDRSSAGNAGWYVYGAQDQAGLFTVQALKPRALVQLKPQRTITNQTEGLNYINDTHWKDVEKRGGTLETVLIDPQNQIEQRSIDWQLGQRAVVMHLFGGRGGKNGEPPMFGTVTGHFSYGMATVVQEPLAQELQWDLRYQQVYATNVEGFISGTNAWTAYMGDLRRGWLGTRPVSDILVKLDVIEDYDFGGVRIAPLAEFGQQLQVINARYRTGDGSGAAVVTPATSCVQDSNQALFATVQQVRQTVAENPAVQDWLKAHPHDPTTLRFRRLIQFGDQVERQLMPLGIVREDWRSNSEALSGTQIRHRTFRRTNATGTPNLLAALTSWRTILPRQTQDELSQLFLKQGAKLWILQTNQIGGNNPDIFPIAPTPAFGQWAIPGTSIAGVAIVLTRLLGAINLPSLGDWAIGIVALVAYGAIAVPLGRRQRFLRRQVWSIDAAAERRLICKLFFLPALVEELIFRLLLLPAPLITPWEIWSLWAIGGLLCFVAYHPLNALTLYKVGHPTFFDPRFLTLAALLGVTCSVTYYLTSSLLLITLIHWVVVVVWLRQLGGLARLSRRSMGVIE
jgi:predicted Abi (CAAX) family protease